MITAAERDVVKWLEQAATWRFFSLYFRLPTAESQAELATLAPEVAVELRELAEIREQLTPGECEQEFHRVLGAGGIPACASSYDDNALAGRGPMLADIAGFYEAFAYRPTNFPAEVPDHLAVELDFLSYLAVKVAFALHEVRDTEADVARSGYERFINEHVRTWLIRFQGQLERTLSPVYVRASARLLECLESPTRTGHGAPRTSKGSARQEG